MVLYSRKFPSSTFEQISHLVNEVVSLTEACCAEGADPECYDLRVGSRRWPCPQWPRKRSQDRLLCHSWGNLRQQLHLL